MMEKYASQVVKQAQAWLGRKEGSAKHREIIDLYNAQKPLPRGYKVKYYDAWCATFVSAVAIELGYTDIIPTECSCIKMIEKLKKLGAWVENENRTPNPGDIIFYDWQDNGKGDNVGSPDHVGIVEKVSGGKITVIEGNFDGEDADGVDGVERRTLYVNGKFIRGYGVPKYDKEPKNPTTSTPSKGTAASSSSVSYVNATDSAKNFKSSLAGTYKVTAKGGLHMRHGAGITKKSMVVLQGGAIVHCYGYYNTSLGVKWLYVQASYNGVRCTGYCSSRYLAKQ